LRSPTKTAASVIQVIRIVNHSYRVTSIALRHGWLPGARYTNLRDVRRYDRLGFLDIDWRNYNFQSHLKAAASTNPLLTVALDIECPTKLSRTLDQAYELARHCGTVIVVPKHPDLAESIEELVPSAFVFGYSVPTRYGGTVIPPANFKRPVHLLGGRPDVQRKLAEKMNVISIDCNRFTLDAQFGDHFDGETFRPHPLGGYERCLESSIKNIDALWVNYHKPF
jgi:hypothetical protein